MIQVLPDVRERIAEYGFCLIRADQFEMSSEVVAAFADFQSLWGGLVADQYIEVQPCPRFRRHTQFRYEPTRRQFIQLAHSSYYQSLVSNPLYGGKIRNFSPFTEDALSNRFLRELMSFNVAHLPEFHRPVHIHSHMVRIVGLADSAGEPSPEGLHQDGFDFVSIHLISRSNVHGGETSVQKLNGEVLVRTALATPMDTLYLNDRLLCHGTSPILPIESRDAIRDVLLFSYDEER